jgi:hypothetical protein
VFVPVSVGTISADKVVGPGAPEARRGEARRAWEREKGFEAHLRLPTCAHVLALALTPAMSSDPARCCLPM